MAPVPRCEFGAITCKRGDCAYGVNAGPRAIIGYLSNRHGRAISHLPALVAWLAFGLAVVFGAVANRVNFCTMGAVTDIVTVGDWRRMRMWLLAIAVAIAGVAFFSVTGTVDFAKSIYTTPNVTWLSYLVGGFMFGFGMTLASGCGSKTLIRLGGGNLKSLVVLIVLAISAYMTLKGLFAMVRVYGLDVVRFDTNAFGAAHSDLPSLFSALFGLGTITRTAVPLIVSCRPMAMIRVRFLGNRDFRDTREMIVGGIVIGAVILGGWYLTGHVAYIAEDPRTLDEAFLGTNSGRPESFSFVAPAAYTLELLMLWSDQSRIVTFGIAGSWE